MATPEIAVDGMKELRKSLRDLSTDNGWRQPLKEAYGAVGSLVQDEAQNRARSGGVTLAGTRASMGSKAVGSIRGKGTTTGASLQAFKGIPWGPGWNFGSSGGHRQFPAKATPDYNLYKAVEDKREQINNEFAEAIEYALEQAFPE
jgi:hypothetical protein